MKQCKALMSVVHVTLVLMMGISSTMAFSLVSPTMMVRVAPPLSSPWPATRRMDLNNYSTRRRRNARSIATSTSTVTTRQPRSTLLQMSTASTEKDDDASKGSSTSSSSSSINGSVSEVWISAEFGADLYAAIDLQEQLCVDAGGSQDWHGGEHF
eukprot:scaffold90336_cov63-Attheya_sp.AAC.1